MVALPGLHRAAAPLKTPKVGVPDKKDPAAILRRGRAAGESIARLGTWAVWLLLGKMEVMWLDRY